MVHEQLREIACDLRSSLLKGIDAETVRNAAERLEAIAAALDYTKHRKPPPKKEAKAETRLHKVRQTFSRA